MSSKALQLPFANLQGNFVRVASDNYSDYQKWRKAVEEWEGSHPEVVQGGEAPDSTILLEYERRHSKMVAAAERASNHLLAGVNAFAKQVEANVRAGMYQDRQEVKAMYMAFAQDLLRVVPNLSDKQEVLKVLTLHRQRIAGDVEDSDAQEG